MDFDATSLYRSSMWSEKYVYPKIETGFVFKPHVNDEYVKSFNDQTFNHNGILKWKSYNPPNPNFQHIPAKEKLKTKKITDYEMDLL